MKGKILKAKSYTKVGADMTWPSYQQEDTEWNLRYGSDQSILAKKMVTASIVNAYKHMIELDDDNRNKRTTTPNIYTNPVHLSDTNTGHDF